MSFTGGVRAAGERNGLHAKADQNFLNEKSHRLDLFLLLLCLLCTDLSEHLMPLRASLLEYLLTHVGAYLFPGFLLRQLLVAMKIIGLVVQSGSLLPIGLIDLQNTNPRKGPLCAKAMY